MTADARHYWRVWPRHGVIAVRGAAAGSWGDDEGRRVFSASGNAPQPGFAFGRDAIGLLRGFDQDDVTGSRAVVLNVDYRLPLMRIDRGIGTVPAFMRSLHGAMFVDVGTHGPMPCIGTAERRSARSYPPTPSSASACR